MASGYDDDRDGRHDDRRDEREDRDADIIDRAKARIKTPAIILLVVGAISLVFTLISVVNVFTMDEQFAKVEDQWDNDPNLTPQQRKDMKQILADLKEPIKIGVPISIVCSLFTSAITILGSIKIMNLKSRGLGTAGSVLSMIPIISGCCCLGVPVGIWVLIALAKPEVKAGFAAVARAARNPHDGY